MNNWGLENRILLLDGAMGTMIQQLNLTDSDYRGERYAQNPIPQKGNNDILCLTRPDVIENIHRQYLEAGADIIETCTFNAQRISMSDYGTEDDVVEINRSAVKIARRLADEFTNQNPLKPRYVAGSIGPTNKTASISPDINNPAARAISFDQLAEAYHEQMCALIESGVDALFIETIFDTLNAKAAIYATEKAFQTTKKRVKIMLSATVADVSGRTLSGQTIQAFVASVAHANLFSIGLNCSFGAKDLKPYLKTLSEIAPCFVSAHPNAGLPNQFGQYNETPESMARQIDEYLNEKLVNIIGGCCGTTPKHIEAIGNLLPNKPIRKNLSHNHDFIVAGLDALKIEQE